MTNNDDDKTLFCHICLDDTIEILEYDKLHVCSKCLSNIKKLKLLKENIPPKLPKEQIAGGIKDEL